MTVDRAPSSPRTQIRSSMKATEGTKKVSVTVKVDSSEYRALLAEMEQTLAKLDDIVERINKAELKCSVDGEAVE